MSDQPVQGPVSQRRSKRVLTAEQKYDLWVRMLRNELSIADAAAEAGVDRSVITRLRGVARDGAIAGLQGSKPGRRKTTREENAELARLLTADMAFSP